jgi:DNA-binding transcriptional MerR regulator
MVRALRAAGYTNDQIRQVMQAVHSDRLENSLAIIDGRHADLHDQRKEVELAIQAINELVTARHAPGDGRPVRNLRIGEAAVAVGVRPSALRFWEQEGLLRPARSSSSGYRTYDERQMRLLKVVALLRRIGIPFDAIRTVVTDIGETGQGLSIDTLSTRRNDIFEASKACTAATATLWNYMCGGDTEHSDDLPIG